MVILWYIFADVLAHRRNVKYCNIYFKTCINLTNSNYLSFLNYYLKHIVIVQWNHKPSACGKSLHTKTFNGDVRTIYGPQGRFHGAGVWRRSTTRKDFLFLVREKSACVCVSINIILATTPRRRLVTAIIFIIVFLRILVSRVPTYMEYMYWIFGSGS